jgi:hypothetical protein
MGDNEVLRVGEFTRAIQALERSVSAGHARIESKLDDYGERIVKLEQADRRDRNKRNAKSVGWGTAAAAGLTVVFEAAKAYFLK